MRFAARPLALALAALLAGASLLAAQQRMRMTMPDSTVYTVTAEGGVPEIPFELLNNHLIFEATVNGRPLDVVLDTGMPVPGLTLHSGPRTEGLGLAVDPAMQVRVGGAGGGEPMTAQMASDVAIAMPGLETTGNRVILLPPLGLGGYHDGIIGTTLLDRFVVEIDYDERRLRLHEPGSWEPPEGAHILPLTMRNRLPYTRVRVSVDGGEPFDTEVVVDLGASHAISLNSDTSERLRPPADALATLLGRGISGPLMGDVGRIARLELGGVRLTDVVASFPVSEHQNPRGIDSLGGNLGSDVLRRFNTTFDYANERMVLVPNKAFSEPFVYDHSGLRFRPGDELVVDHVVPGSPGAAAGVHLDDVLTGVDGEPVTGASYDAVRRALMAPGEVKLTLRRGDGTVERTVKLRPLI